MVRSLSGPVVARERRSWPSLPTSARQQVILRAHAGLPAIRRASATTGGWRRQAVPSTPP